MNKWIGLSLGTLLGVSHIGMISMISQGNKFPRVNLQINEYTSYTVEAGPDGYKINYRAHDPKVMVTLEKGERPAGFLGFGKKKVYNETQYMAQGKLHLDPPVDEDGNPASHYELYLDAMKQCGANTMPIEEFVNNVKDEFNIRISN